MRVCDLIELLKLSTHDQTRRVHIRGKCEYFTEINSVTVKENPILDKRDVDPYVIIIDFSCLRCRGTFVTSFIPTYKKL